MLEKSPQKLMLQDLAALIGNVREGKTIEFKREMPAQTADEKTKFLAAVSSLANTAGGDLLIGVEAKDGLAIGVPGIEIPNVDGEKLRLTQILASQIEPRLPLTEMEAVDCTNGRYVLVIRAMRSWIGPHRVMTNDRFYGRNSAGKYPLDVSEIRTAFVLSETAAEHIRNFRNDRLMKLAAGETPLVLAPGALTAIHVVPYSTFASRETLDIAQAIQNGHVMALPPGRMGHPNQAGFNLDGVITFTQLSRDPPGGYAQVFRSGAVEGVDVLSADDESGDPYIAAPLFENTIVQAVKNYLSLLKDLGLGYPAFVFLSFTGMTKCRFRTRTEFGSGFYASNPLGRAVVALPEVSIENDQTDVAAALRPIFNSMWNGFGLPGSDKYDQKGKWIGTA